MYIYLCIAKMNLDGCHNNPDECPDNFDEACKYIPIFDK